MMRANQFVSVSSLLFVVACASDSPAATELPSTQAEDMSVGTAFYGLTVKDCHGEATECLGAEGDERSWASRSLYCGAELRACLGDVVVEAAGNVAAEAAEITQCGQTGLSCYVDAGRISEALDCRNAVEVCVNTRVEELTGIELPTTRQVVGAAVDATAAVVETTVEVAGQVVDRAVERAGAVVEAAGDVAEVITAPARRVIACAEEARQCRRDREGFLTCRRAYQTCLFSAPSETDPGVVLQ